MAHIRSRTIWLVALLAGVALSAWLASAVSGTASARVGAAQDSPPAGERLYLRDCAVCHGDDGEGTLRGPSLEGDGAASVDFNLRTGRMPITGPNVGLQRPNPPDYSAREIAAIVDHLRPVVEGGPPIPEPDPAAGDVARGGALYRTHCAGCHGTAGVGGALVFADQSTPALGTSSPKITAEAVLVGPGTMPVLHPEPLDDDALEDVVAYVDGVLNDPPDPGGWHLWHLGPVPEGAVGWILGLGLLLLVARWIGSTVKAHLEEDPEHFEETTA